MLRDVKRIKTGEGEGERGSTGIKGRGLLDISCKSSPDSIPGLSSL
jgi:hypothetical protein